ncbi:ESX secretion-associated protein EspG [Saccharopolyspora dendranthemae]|uniref:ESAT-6 protein secretion system EspG family protein n=1 Tax=Saccharopolyspora dendranthemae TaxID=1181886 RepID=A0A561VAK2_9PSEU|nr:ESX secretion-associated protein EspG [Saccharopolyspora dendranthemae]TWG08620.1 ESAT-6 protein secretion system EspG family protein [Saccharopolyspora dendranthemae]
MQFGQRELGALLVDVVPEVAEFLGVAPAPGDLSEQGQEVARVLTRASVFGLAEVRVADEPELRAIVAVGDGGGIRVRARGEDVTADVVRPDAPWPALVGCLPKSEPADGCEVTVPTRELSEARVESAERDQAADWLAYELKQREVPTDDARAVADLLARGDGTEAWLRVAYRDEDGAFQRWRHGIEVRHSPTGRSAVIPESPDDTFTMVAPADAYLLGKTLQEYLEDLTQSSE